MPVKPFLLLATRDHDEAAAAEYASIRKHTGLGPAELVQFRAESAPLPELDLDDYSGVLLGGSSFNVSDAVKSDVQLRVEADLARVITQVVERDLPFLGLCYGVGTITSHLGGVVDKTYAEPVGATPITLTPDGLADPLLAGVPEHFEAFVGHKEACTQTPPGATLLATGQACPVQMYRVGANVYVTQFHPELDAEDLAARIRVYEHAGYFRPEELEDLIAAAQASGVSGQQHLVLSNFAHRYARD